MRDLHLLPLGVSPDRRSQASLYHQIYDGLRSAILDGRLESGTRLPSTRAAAAELGVARNTVVAVFEQLAAEGFVRSRVGDGTRVADIEPELLSRPARKVSGRSDGTRTHGFARAARSALSARGEAIVGVGRGARVPRRVLSSRDCPTFRRSPIAPGRESSPVTHARRNASASDTATPRETRGCVPRLQPTSLRCEVSGVRPNRWWSWPGRRRRST